ncbi:SRPBCC family protein [Pelagicoccus mobilis]|uniref:SRPBCC family protein n=1 Tax=Pelagicoccus mobilis TaxID=415221 RepID=A0A934RY57_9BACT|nr:SRPBCC family protein [Pelagicoccus mobilis]MBK1877620.1 SRPBCC family protein [Pelagicoccus mobilis]
MSNFIGFPRVHTLNRKQFIPRPIDVVWEFFSDPRNLDEMTPPFLRFEILSGADFSMFAGQVIEYRIRVLPGVRQRWVTEISHCQPREYFVDEQRLGPYRFWHHLHAFQSVSDGTIMTDRVNYVLPFGPLGLLVHSVFVKRRLKRIFDFRSQYLEKRFGASRALFV